MFKPEYILICPEKINWEYLSLNPNAIELLEKNLDKVDWEHLSLNPNAIHLFAKLDQNTMRLNCQPFAEDLMKYVLNPARLVKLCELYNLDLEE